MIDEPPPADLRVKDVFHHIDMGFVNHRLCMTAIGESGREAFRRREAAGNDHLAVHANNHLLITLLLDLCDAIEALTLHQALEVGKPTQLFRSTEKLDPCPEVYDAARVTQTLSSDLDYGKPVVLCYHTSHLASDTGRMMLAQGGVEGYRESIVGLLHDRGDRFEIEPIVMGAPWYDHPRNGDDSSRLMWEGLSFGEILPEDIDQFRELAEVEVSDANEWMEVMRNTPESFVKECFTQLLGEPDKKDWGGEPNDHYSGSLEVAGRRKTAAFLLKGPSQFREMTLEMCGKRADQIHRLTNSGADISIVQHCHLIGEVVRVNLKRMVIYPGSSHRKYCVIDGQSTFRILRAYGFV